MPATVSALFVGCPPPLVERIGDCLDDAGIVLDSQQSTSEAELTQRLAQGTDVIMVDARTSQISRDRLVDLRREAQSEATIIFLVSARDENTADRPANRDRCDVIPQDDLHQLVRTVRRAMVEKLVRPETPATPKPQDGVMEKELQGLLHLIQDDSAELLSAPACNARGLKKAHQLKQAADHTVRLMQQLLNLQPPPGQQP